MTKKWLVGVLVCCCAGMLRAEDFVAFRAQAQDAPVEQLTRYLNSVALRHLEDRARRIAGIRTREQAERYRETIREKVLALIGGLPDYRCPLNTKQAGVLDRGDYRIEKVIYESLPGLYVPANVYVPAHGSGPFPAILMPVGHGDDGKASGQRQIAIGFARKGFIALTYDPLGQGERFQHYDPDLRYSRVGMSTDQHSHDNGHTILLGDSFARYRIWDGMRAIDYLLTRKDVDAGRVGCTGCSGGGTLTTYISALDDRVKVAAPACYMTSWEELLPGPGPQDGEQIFARFLSEGLNQADFVHLFAPKPWLIASTIEDFFPLEGARQTYAEAQRFYALYGARDRVQWFVGPGPHGVPPQSREALYAWFIRWFQDGKGDPSDNPVKLEPPENLLCTETGQVADSLGGETVFTLNRKRAVGLIPAKPAIAAAGDVTRLRTRLLGEVRDIAAIQATPGAPPPVVKVHRVVPRDGYRIEVVSYETEGGVRVPGLLLVSDAVARKAVVLVADSRPKQTTAAPGGDLENLVRAGYLVFSIQPRGTPEVAVRTTMIGDYRTNFRAYLVGRTLLGMRVDDIIRAVDYLASRPDAARGRIIAFGQGTLAPALLHAAVIDERIASVVFQQAVPSWRMVVERPLHRNLYQIAVPGALKHYDLDELLVALDGRPVTIVNPCDPTGRPISHREFRDRCRMVFDSDVRLGRSGRVRLRYRAFRDPLHEFLE